MMATNALTGQACKAQILCAIMVRASLYPACPC